MNDQFQIILCTDYLRRGDNVIDVGANTGEYTVALSKCIGQDGTVFSFEPEEQNLIHLQRRVSRLRNVQVCPVALGNGEQETCNLYLSPENPGDHHTWEDSKDKRDVVVVRKSSIDKEIKKSVKINLIKVDVQGSEVEVLRGAKETILRQTDLALIIEFWPKGLRGAGSSPEEFADLLYNVFGFRVFHIWNGSSIFPPCISFLKKERLLLWEQGNTEEMCDFCELWCIKRIFPDDECRRIK